MSPKFLRPLFLALSGQFALSSCEVFKKDEPAQDSYAAANPYAAGAQNPGYSPPANAYGGNPGAVQPPGSYAQPNYNTQPYTQPPAGNYSGNTGAGYAGGYDAGAYSGGNTAGNYAAGSGRSHQVVRGDTLSGLSRRYGVGVSELMRANNLNSDRIIEGQKLNIP